MITRLAESPACRNCGARLDGPFCAACGQEDRPLQPSLGEVAGEFAREISDLDGRIVRSVRRLFLSPGFLTNQHLQGRRVAWVSPVRLYLIFSVAYFALTSLTGTSPLSINLRFTGDTDTETTQTIQKLGFSTEAEMQRAVNQALAVWIPRAMFVLLPVFGWLVFLVRRRSARKYPQHLIFALHVFAAFFGTQALAVAADYVAGHSAVGSALGIISVSYIVVYMVVALRAVYGGTVARAVGHAVVVLALYWLATIVTAALIIAPVFWWR